MKCSVHPVCAIKLVVALTLALFLVVSAWAAPLSPDEISSLCAEADGPTHCARLVEARQLKRLPNLALREGNELRISLYPSGTTVFADAEGAAGERSFSLWDFISEINAVVLYATDGDRTSFILLQRTSARKFELPSEPKLSPDRQRIATADFCAEQCVNDVSIWRVSRDGVQRELVWRPTPPWAEAAVTWRDADTLAVEYTPAGNGAPQKIERRLTDSAWSRSTAP